MAYHLWKGNKIKPPFPWPCDMVRWEDRQKSTAHLAENNLGRIGLTVESVLMKQGKFARNRDVRESAYRRIDAAVNRIGPYLFPLVATAEQKVIGTRDIAPSKGGLTLRAGRYELTGVIDVLTHVTLASVSANNVIRNAVETACGMLPAEFEVIVDYKGARRPGLNEDYWTHGAWQIQTYAWLRGRQQGAMPVAAGILLYVNELDPGTDDFQALKRELQKSNTDVVPAKGSKDYYNLQAWSAGKATSSLLSEEFRLRRAIRVISIDTASIQSATQEFDKVVSEIEQRVSQEAACSDIMHAWPPTCADEGTCVACDFKSFCPKPAGAKKGYVPETPLAP